MMPRDFLSSPAKRGICFSATIGLVVLWLVVKFLSRGNEQTKSPALVQAATEIIEAEQARKAATTAIESARSSARRAEGDVAVALARSVAAHLRARVIGMGNIRVTATPNAAPFDVPLPTPVFERLRLDSNAVAVLGALVQRKETLIVAQDQRIAADSIELAATSIAFTALQRVKEPRCGRRCGIVLGVGGTLLAAIAVGQVRRTFR